MILRAVLDIIFIQHEINSFFVVEDLPCHCLVVNIKHRMNWLNWFVMDLEFLVSLMQRMRRKHRR